MDASPSGSSGVDASEGRTSRSAVGVRIRSSCWVAKYRATLRKWTDSSNEGSLKETERLRTLPGAARDMQATIEVESIPPDKKTPRGTSDIRRHLTASSRVCR